jgi:hypothetical protein
MNSPGVVRDMHSSIAQIGMSGNKNLDRDTDSGPSGKFLDFISIALADNQIGRPIRSLFAMPT